MMIVTLPFVFPVVKQAGIDGIWFGILLVKLVEIATMTSPVGLNLFVVAATGKGYVIIEDLIRGVWPFIVLELRTAGVRSRPELRDHRTFAIRTLHSL